MGCTVDELLGRISARELSEWMAYAQVEPFGEKRADLRAGIVASTMANIHRGKRQAFKPDDFMPEFERTEQAPEEMQALLQSMFGGRS